MFSRFPATPRSRPGSRTVLASLAAHAILGIGVIQFHQPEVVRLAGRRNSEVEVRHLEILTFPASRPPASPPNVSATAEEIRPPAPPRLRPQLDEAINTAGPGTSLEVESARDLASSSPAFRPPLRAGFSDPRLFPDRRFPPAATPSVRSVQDVARARILADLDSVASRKARDVATRQASLFGRKFTVLGDSAAAGFRSAEIELRRDVQTLAVDGRRWEQLELSNQRARFERDSILRERTRATRAQADAGRAVARGRE